VRIYSRRFKQSSRQRALTEYESRCSQGSTEARWSKRIGGLLAFQDAYEGLVNKDTAEFKDFNGGWVEIFAEGNQTDSEGRKHAIDAAFLEAAARHYSPDVHDAPAVVGHPESDAPAYGWVKAVRKNGTKLEALFNEVNPEFETAVTSGAFKKRSASFYVDPATAPNGKVPYLRHVGFLGAQPPAVKGLRNIQFAASDKATTFEINFSEDEAMKDEEVNGIVERVWSGLKEKLGIKSAEPANFNEANLEKKITEAVTASFSEEIKQRDVQLEELKKRVDQQSNATARAEAIAFVESIGKDKLPPALRPGLVEFMSTLDGGTAAESPKVIVIEFTEEAGVKKETKSESSQLAFFKEWISKLPAMLSFGEQFGAVRGPGSEGVAAVTPERTAELRAKAGLPPKETVKS
jgi:hypothetical protein